MFVLAPLGLILTVWLLGIVLTWWLAGPRTTLRILDYPNERSLHATPMPRTGGVAILAAVGSGELAVHLIWGSDPVLAWITGGALGLAGVSFLEDHQGVARRFRLLVQLLAAVLLLSAGLAPKVLQLGPWIRVLPTSLAWGLGLLATVWMTNLYNFMDGMDGLSGGMALIGFSTLALLGWQAQDSTFALVNGVIAAAAAGFLVWNFPPARIFMGDTGSTTLGYLVAAMSLWGARDGLFPLWAAALLFSPFIVDATATLLRRLSRRERIWEAHRDHYYQRLVCAGWGHRKTVLAAYLLMLACAVGALNAGRLAPIEQLWLLGSWSLIYLLLAWRIELWIHTSETKTS